MTIGVVEFGGSWVTVDPVGKDAPMGIEETVEVVGKVGAGVGAGAGVAFGSKII